MVYWGKNMPTSWKWPYLINGYFINVSSVLLKSDRNLLVQTWAMVVHLFPIRRKRRQKHTSQVAAFQALLQLQEYYNEQAGLSFPPPATGMSPVRSFDQSTESSGDFQWHYAHYANQKKSSTSSTVMAAAATLDKQPYHEKQIKSFHRLSQYENLNF